MSTLCSPPPQPVLYSAGLHDQQVGEHDAVKREVTEGPSCWQCFGEATQGLAAVGGCSQPRCFQLRLQMQATCIQRLGCLLGVFAVVTDTF